MKNLEHAVIWVILILMVLFAMLAFTLPPAKAQAANCAGFDAIHLLVTKTYHQSDIGGGRLNATTALRIYSALDGTTFSMVVVRANGQACIVATGEGLDVTPPKSASEKEG